MGLQRVDWKTKITASKSSKAARRRSRGGRRGRQCDASADRKAGTYWSFSEGRYMPLEDYIWFLQFTTWKAATISVEEVDQRQCGYSTWRKQAGGDGHDNSPPKNPPD